MVFPIYSVTYFEWHTTNNPEMLSEETKKLWEHYKQLELRNKEMGRLLKEKAYKEMTPERHIEWLLEVDALLEEQDDER